MAEISAYKVAASPHKSDNANTRRIMLDVLIALLPCVVCGTVFFGLYSLMLVVICTAVCFAAEQLCNLARKKPFTFDLSALVTGVILGLNLPPRAPWYIPVIGGVFAVVIVKMLFGGLGKNFANPAATARVFLLLAYSATMSQFIGADPAGNLLSADVSTGATYLTGGTSALAGSFWGAEGYWANVLQLLFGSVGGSIGETCKVAVLAGGAYLLVRRVIDWRIPLVYLLTSAVMALALWGSASEVLLQLLSGGLLFGAFFMATDYATSPKWRYNRVLYAVGLGVITMLIRRFGSYPEGVSLAILIMNLIVPVMDKFILPVRFGQRTKAGKPYPQVMKWAMRGLCVALAASLAVSVPVVFAAERNRPEEQELPAAYRYVQSMATDPAGNYIFGVKGSALIEEYDYTQPLEYEVTLSSSEGTVTAILPVEQSTMGYEAEISLFIGKTYAAIRDMTDLSGTDADTSATYTNTALKAMIEECFVAMDAHANALALPASFRCVKAAADTSLADGKAYLVAGSAKITDEYTQQLLYYVIVKDGKVADILPLVQSTMGYTAELSLFIGKDYAGVNALSDADVSTSATLTNTALKGMVLESLVADDALTNALALPASFRCVKAAADTSLADGKAYLVAGSAKITDEYTQQLLYYVIVKDGKVADILPLVQSTMGYTAELSLFIGKDYAGVNALSDADVSTSATLTNTALKGMVLESLVADDVLTNARPLDGQYTYVRAAVASSALGGERFLAEGYADLYEYDYKQPLLYYIRIEGGRVEEFHPLVQSTMGYEAELSLFVGKTRAEIEGLSSLAGADAGTSATRTNTALKAMLLECFEAEVDNG